MMPLRLIVKEVAEQHSITNASQLQQKAGLTYPLTRRLWQGGNMESVNLRALEAIGRALGVKAKDLLEEVEG